MKKGYWILFCVIAAVIVISSGFVGYIIGKQNAQQVQTYLKLASDYDKMATESMQTVSKIWDAYNEKKDDLRLPQVQEWRRGLEVQAKHYTDLAEEYRQQALKYRELANE
jgi:hypothetical protein